MPASPLHDLHGALGARFTDFGGWEMPVQYEGVIAEHDSVRDAVGVFDVSHLGRFSVAGSAATDMVRRRLCNDILNADPGKAQYTMALNELGGIVDDIIVWRFDSDEYWIMPNGTNFDDVMGGFAAEGSGAVVESLREDSVLIAVQGPESPGVVETVIGTMPRRFHVARGSYAGSWYRAAGTGYTGEVGAEICVPVESGKRLFSALVAAGAAPCGLGARDILRLEMGYPLWGQDIDESTTPLEAGVGWVVAWDHDFIGRRALQRQRSEGVDKRLVAFSCQGRQIPRHGYHLRAGTSSGTVTSGNFSPSLRRGIGMGYLAPPDDGAAIEIQIRNTWVAGERVDPPFIDR
jgi:glycine cleavage system T protein (aminomethyltransferase)